MIGDDQNAPVTRNTLGVADMETTKQTCEESKQVRGRGSRNVRTNAIIIEVSPPMSCLRRGSEQVKEDKRNGRERDADQADIRIAGQTPIGV